MSATGTVRLGFGFGFDLLEGGLEELTLFLAGLTLQRSGIQKRDQDGQAGEANANQPVADERQVSQPAL